MGKWPRDNQAALIKFYGDPGKGEVERQLVKVVPPFQIYYSGRPLKSISFHKKAAPALLAALNEIWERSGRSQALLDKEGVSDCAGTYNPRYVRGAEPGNKNGLKPKWSNHAFGAAIDLDAKANGLGVKGDMPSWVVAAFKRQGARWGGDYKGRKDPMHFEFCDAGPVQVAALGAVDMPHMDADDREDVGMDMSGPPAHDVAPDAPFKGKAPWHKRVWAWLSGGGVGALGLSAFDWRVAAVFGGIAFIVFLFVWFGYLRPKLRKEFEDGK